MNSGRADSRRKATRRGVGRRLAASTRPATKVASAAARQPVSSHSRRQRLVLARRELQLLVSDEELARRAAAQPVQPPHAERGYRKLWHDHVLQADQGVDFDFLRAAPSGVSVPRS